MSSRNGKTPYPRITELLKRHFGVAVEPEYIPPTIHWKKPGTGIVFNKWPPLLSINEGGRGPIFAIGAYPYRAWIYVALWTRLIALRWSLSIQFKPGDPPKKEITHEKPE